MGPWDDGYGTMAQIDAIKAAKPKPAGAVVLQKLSNAGMRRKKTSRNGRWGWSGIFWPRRPEVG